MKRPLRVCIDFRGPEIDALQSLCDQDFRLPSDELKYFFIEKARLRGLLPPVEEYPEEYLPAQQSVAA